MHHRTSIALSLLLLLASIETRPLAAQSPQWREWEICTPSLTQTCASMRIDAAPSINGTDFQISIANLGSGAHPSAPAALYSFILGTGAAASSGFDLFPAPTAIGGATVADPTPWWLFDAGDALFLSSAGQSGIGGCAAGPAQQGWYQMAHTCGAGAAISFTGSTTSALDLSKFSLFDLQLVMLDANLTGDYCGALQPCVVVRDVSSVPEPSTVVLTGSAMLALFAVRVRGRRREGIGS